MDEITKSRVLLKLAAIDRDLLNSQRVPISDQTVNIIRASCYELVDIVRKILQDVSG